MTVLFRRPRREGKAHLSVLVDSDDPHGRPGQGWGQSGPRTRQGSDALVQVIEAQTAMARVASGRLQPQPCPAHYCDLDQARRDCEPATPVGVARPVHRGRRIPRSGNCRRRCGSAWRWRTRVRFELAAAYQGDAAAIEDVIVALGRRNFMPGCSQLTLTAGVGCGASLTATLFYVLLSYDHR